MRYISESDATEQYNEFLDEIYPEVVINRDSGAYWPASRVIAEMDPIAYRLGVNEWLDSNDLTTDESAADPEEDDEELAEDEYDASEECGYPAGTVVMPKPRPDTFGDPLTQY